MKVYAPIKTNLVQNPKLHEFITVAGPNFCGLRAAFSGGGGSHGFRDSEESPTGRYFYHSAGTTVSSGFADYYSRSVGTASPLVPTATDIQAKEGDVFYVTLVARATAVPSTGTMPRSAIRYAWRGADGTTIGNTFYDLPIGNHGTEYATVSGALNPAPAGAVSLGIQVEGRFGANNATGDEIRYVGATITKNQANTECFDGDTPGYSWSDTPNNSITVSDEKEFGDREVRVNAIVNKVRNPDFIGSGSSATGWTNYQSGTVTGTRLFNNNSLSLSVTSIVGGNRRYGVCVTDTEANPLNRIFVKKGDRIYARVAVDTSGLAAGTVAYLYFETRRSDGTVISYVGNFVVVSGFLTLDWTATVDTYINTYYILAISATGSSYWTGTSTVVFSKAMWTHLRAGETPPDWFDGNSPGAQWNGTANNSTSTKSGWRTTSVRSYDGTGWVAG